MFNQLASAVLCFALVSAVCCDTGAETEPSAPSSSDPKKALTRDCANAYSVTCLKLDVISWVDNLSENAQLNIIPGVSVVRENTTAAPNTAEIVANLARDFPNDPDARLDAFLSKKISSYLNSHSVRLNFWETEEEKDAVSGRQRKPGRRGGGMGTMMAAAAMVKGTLLALALAALAGLAGKALMTSLISLLLSAIIGLKSLTSGHKQTTYEVVSKPIYTSSASHSVSHEDGGHYGSYARNFEVPIAMGLQKEYKHPY